MKLWKEEVRTTRKKVLVAHSLREAREAAQLTQDGLAAKVGVTNTMISYLEKGKREASVKLARSIFNILTAQGVKLQWK